MGLISDVTQKYKRTGQSLEKFVWSFESSSTCWPTTMKYFPLYNGGKEKQLISLMFGS